MWPFARKQILPPDDRSYDEKLGIEVTPGAWTDEQGRDWQWVCGQFHGEKFWHPDRPNSLIDVRRKAWPIKYVMAGLVLPAGDGGTRISQEYRVPWRVWRSSDTGDQSTFVGGLCWGWGGALGADHDADDWVPVCGQRVWDGTGYQPSDDDLAATDWELVKPNIR